MVEFMKHLEREEATRRNVQDRKYGERLLELIAPIAIAESWKADNFDEGEVTNSYDNKKVSDFLTKLYKQSVLVEVRDNFPRGRKICLILKLSNPKIVDEILKKRKVLKITANSAENLAINCTISENSQKSLRLLNELRRNDSKIDINISKVGFIVVG